MTTTNNESQKSKATEPAPAQNKNTAANISLYKQHLGTLITGAIALIALIFSLISFTKVNSYQQSVDDQKNQFGTKLASIEQEQTRLTANLANLGQTLQLSKEGIQQQVSDLNQNLHKALRQRHYQRHDWLLLKAKYYLELAQINAHWSDSQDTTIALLQAADTVLQDVSDQQLFNIRQTIAKEITSIKAIPKLDLAGLLSQLDAAQQMVSALPLKQGVNLSTDTTPSDADTPAEGWKTKLHENMKLLEKLIVVRKHDDNVEPILSPLHLDVLRESVRMNLQEAQWALLEHNSAVYAQSLKQAIEEINRIFDVSASPTQALLNDLQKLKSVSLENQRPLVNGSLNLLNQFIDNQKNASSDDSTNGAPQ
ncbi:uroporphyrinogen III methylase [Legionella birminghamensis]|uniref:Uroporphyrin-III C-methyltransferase n=1 Tax=Legionella birminghamensis TaxID=28083 RepID=A0A378ICA3_9GAMM|nr:uroporphyrinogen-III C-methyltransferase [Legionella birminghamensis]KTC72586.1 uroporphyrinogen III methylase [Legionella birminghamensis]STX32858.1 uroporphyrin-III C-methyltransferase [Legionella birminghamensis]